MSNSDGQVTTINVQQGAKAGDKPSARTSDDLQDGTRQQMGLTRQVFRAGAPKPIYVHNTGGEDIPANSPAEIVGRNADGGLNVDRPTAASLQPALVLFTKENTIVAGEDGFMYSAFDEVLECQTDAAGVLASGYGTQVDSFEMIVDNTGFVCLGEGGAEAMMRPFRSVAIIGYAIAGFDFGPFARTDAHEEYNSASNAWTNKTVIATAREGLSASTISGKVYAYSGNDSGGDLKDCEEFDPSGDSWTGKTDSSFTHEVGTGITLGIKGYVWAGDTGGTDDDCEEFDAAGNSWAGTQATLSTRFIAAAAPIGTDTGYLFGGAGFLVTTEEYSVSGDSWSGKADMPAPGRDRLVGMALGGKVYALTGNGTGVGSMADADEYDPVGNSWSSKTNAPTARAEASGFGSGTKGYVTGGNQPAVDRLTQEYDSAADSWAGKGNMLNNHEEHAGAAL